MQAAYSIDLRERDVYAAASGALCVMPQPVPAPA